MAAIFDVTPSVSPLVPRAVQDSTSTSETELWEVILVASCPIIFIIFLCVCVICLVVRSYERRANFCGLPVTHRVQAASQISSILRQLPPPPKYEIAVTSVDAPPPTYADIGKDLLVTPLRTTPSNCRPAAHRRPFQNTNQTSSSSTVQPLGIQYLYPPKYEVKQSEPKTTETTIQTTTSTQARVQSVVVEINS
ncbi:unnamed protein product [Caenorhabditis auriculariae]|uniref:Uncharacterized protein n=1 Tax=Caenorhabditis auriculariae TaxID=2777116 RepID=A0A8S1HWF4_9PELO|nr:unnamed protein product [Caenorhabditis auriculariae]